MNRGNLMRTIAAAASAALLTSCGSPQGPDERGEQSATAAPREVPPPVASATPDLARCPERVLLEEGLRERSGPIAVPPALAGVVRSDVDNLAVVTLAGATLCIDASWMEAIRNPVLSPDRRFASFDWDGYEAFGHVIVDRAGNGQSVDTGVPPVASPSGTLLAAADLGEAGYGALNAFAVWRIEPARVRQVAKHAEVPSAYDWRIEGWRGETCVEISSIDWETFSAETSGPRERFHARENEGWRIEPGRCGT
jgi:hypothetical protein